MTLLLLEVYTAVWLFYAFSEMQYGIVCTFENPCVFLTHITQLAFVVLLRWLYFLLYFLATSTIGEHILPAYNAMLSKESVFFVIYFFLMVGACFCAYFMFP